MARARLPAAKAATAGADIKNPGRYRDRRALQRTRPIGEPYATMNEAQKAAWAELRNELPWLTSSHRVLLRLACIWIARIDETDFGVNATQQLSAILSKLGATPVDESKVAHPAEDEDDDEFFGPH